MQIYNYRAYATILGNELSKHDKDLQNNPLQATLVWFYDGFILDMMIQCSILIAVFVFWFMFSSIVKGFRYFWDCNILEGKSPSISDWIGDMYSI